METTTVQLSKSRKAYIAFVLISLALSITGCASSGLRDYEGAPRQDAIKTVWSGQARLGCGLSCSGKWGLTRAKAKSQYENALWEDLALNVAGIGFEIDQAYFYLARAAEGLGHAGAAQIYYKLALVAKNKCAGIINNCDGLDIPGLAKSRLGSIAGREQGTRVETLVDHGGVLQVFAAGEIIATIKNAISSSLIRVDSYSTADEIAKFYHDVNKRIGLSSVFVPCPCQKKYASDKQSYEISIFPHIGSTIKLNALHDKGTNGLLLSEERKFLGTYVASNAFGVSKEISRYKISEAVVGYRLSHGDGQTGLGSARKSRIDGYRFLAPIAPSTAREEENNIGCVIRIQFEKPYLVEYKRTITPTLSVPIEAEVEGVALIGKLAEIRVVNNKTYETYAVFE